MAFLLVFPLTALTARLLKANAPFFLFLLLTTATSFASPTPREQSEHYDQHAAPASSTFSDNIQVDTDAWTYVGQADTGTKTRQGQGVCTWKNSGQKYDGGWKDGKQSGRGVLTCAPRPPPAPRPPHPAPRPHPAPPRAEPRGAQGR